MYMNNFGSLITVSSWVSSINAVLQILSRQVKTLCVCGSAPGDKRQFRAKTTVSTQTNFELLLLNKEERKNKKMALFYHTLLPRGF